MVTCEFEKCKQEKSAILMREFDFDLKKPNESDFCEALHLGLDLLNPSNIPQLSITFVDEAITKISVTSANLINTKFIQIRFHVTSFVRLSMDINQLEVLVTVAQEKSFSRAAEVLHRTQPAISQAVRRLEEEIGEKLFDRSSKDGTLTQEGMVLLEYARQMLNLRHTAQNAIREVRDLHTGKVTISANEHTVFSLLPVIAEFTKRHPHVKVEVRRGVASRIPKEIAARDVELGVISFQPSDNSLKSVPVMTDELLLIVSPGHKLAQRKSVSISELGDETFIAHNAHSPYREKVIETFTRHKTKLSISIELPSLEAIKRLVESGVGVALVPKLAAGAEVAAGKLCGLSVKEMKLERKLNIVYRKNSTLSYAAREFLKIAQETVT